MKKQSKNKEHFRIRFYIFAGIMIVIMGMIFYFSAQNAGQSEMESGGVLKWLCMHLGKINPWLHLENGMFFVRKTAHFTEYFLLGIFVGLTYREWHRRKRRGMQTKRQQVIPAAVCILYAFTDEFHQYFVPGRACRIIDVGIDSLGAYAGILLLFLSLILMTNHRMNIQEREPLNMLEE